jgi:hypothetical protein
MKNFTIWQMNVYGLFLEYLFKRSVLRTSISSFRKSVAWCSVTVSQWVTVLGNTASCLIWHESENNQEAKHALVKNM